MQYLGGIYYRISQVLLFIVSQEIIFIVHSIVFLEAELLLRM